MSEPDYAAEAMVYLRQCSLIEVVAWMEYLAAQLPDLSKDRRAWVIALVSYFEATRSLELEAHRIEIRLAARIVEAERCHKK